MTTHFDLAIVGAGIVGTAHALAAAKRGLKTAIFERKSRAMGASVRNFGMVFPTVQKGIKHQRALLSRPLWRSLSEAAGFACEPAGTLFVARLAEEEAVLRAFEEQKAEQGYPCRFLSPEEALKRSPYLKKEGLLGALYSQEELLIDPGQAMAKLHQYLADHYPVSLFFQHTVTQIQAPRFIAADRIFTADQILVCNGTDFNILYPQQFQESGLVPCKLQMMRTEPLNGPAFGPSLGSGLSLCYYGSFQEVPGIEALKRLLKQRYPEHFHYGIHVMASQNRLGELLIGDSHEYGFDLPDEQNHRINHLIMSYLRTFVDLPELQTSASWSGTYAGDHKKAEWTMAPERGVRIVTGIGGAGMTTAFALAEETLNELGL